MAQRSMLGASLLAFASALTVALGYQRQPAPARQASASPSRPAIEQPDTSPYHEGRRLLTRLLGDIGQLSGRQLDIVIATVPDPLDSHLDWQFDLEVDAFRKAYETAGYVTDWYWLPWLKRAVDSGVVARDSTARYRKPGVMLFRTPDGQRLSLLYLVGELPTTGVRKLALRAALDERDSLLRWRDPQSFAEIRVIGPSFSGSALSLKLVLDAYTGATSARIVSGSATAPGVAAMLRESPRITYSATVHSDSALAAVRDANILAILRSRDDSGLAILGEGSTTYGYEVKSDSRQQSDLAIPFPLNVATLRAAYDRNRGADSGTSRLGASGPLLPLRLDDPPTAAENPPPMSALTLPTIDRAFEDVARMLRAHDVRYVEIDATDVRDKIFLAAQVKQRLSDVQLLTRDTHLLFGHPDLSASLRGMLTVSSYPPGLRNQSRVIANGADHARRVVFASDVAEGAYNAMLIQLGQDEALADYRWPFDSTCQTPDCLVPPVWISVVGAGGIVAVNAVRVGDSQLLPVQRAGRVVREPRPRRLITLVAALVLAALAALFAWRDRRVWRRPFRKCGAAADVQSRLLTTLGLATALFPAAAAAFSSQFGMPVSDYIGYALIVFGLGLVLVPLGSYVVRGLWRCRQNRKTLRIDDFIPDIDRWPVLIVSSVVCAAAVWFAIETWWPWHAAPGHALLIDRITMLTRGVSPIPPLILIGLGQVTWGIWNRQRLRQLASTPTIFERWIADPKRPPASVHTEQAAKSVRRIRDRMARAGNGLFIGVFLGLLVALGFAHCLVIATPLEEVSRVWLTKSGALAFRVALALGIVIGVGVPVWMTAQFWLIWMDLRKALDSFARLPLWSAFERLPAFASRITQLAVLSGGWRIRLRCLVAVTHMQANHLETMQHKGRIALPGTKPTWNTSQPMDTFNAVWPNLEFLWAIEPDADVMKVMRDAGSTLPMRSESATFVLQPSMLGEFRRAFPTDLRIWMRGAEEWCAVHVIAYVEWVFGHLTRITRYVLYSIVFTTLLLLSYPYYPQDYMSRVFFVIMSICAVTLIVLMAQINRNEMISAITNTAPGKLSWDGGFGGNMILLIGVPLITLLSAAFPSVRAFLFAWVRPLVTVIGKGG